MPVRVITIDTFRAGGVEQLRAFMRILKISLQVAQNPNELKNCLAQSDGTALTLIDSAGTNPFIKQEMDELKGNIDASNAEPLLVMSAGGDAMESAETSESFSNLGVSRMLVTRLDLTRRLGGLLAAAEAGKLRFSDVSITPNVGEGLTPINPVALARLLLPESLGSIQDPELSEAVL